MSKIIQQQDIYYLEGSYENYATAQNGIVSKTKIYFTAYLTTDNAAVIDTFTNIIGTRMYTSGSTQIQYYGSEHGIYNFVDYTTKTSFTDYLPTIIIWTVIIIVAIYLVSRLSKSVSQAGAQQFNFNTSRAKKATHSTVRFKDVAGCDEVKNELVELVDYFHNGKKYTRLGAKLPKGILLVGPPGTGKTLLAKAVAGEANVPFYSISGSDFVEMYVGVGAGRVRDMFRIAKKTAPCLVFIDEIDAVGRQRGAGLGGGNDEREQTLNQLLVEMDGFEDNSGVIIMAATNRADILDPALTRAGRFDRQITVDLPDKDGREAILKVHSRNKIVGPDVDFRAIASRTVGFSGADLANIMNDAAILAVRGNKQAITTDDIDEAIDRSIAGPAKSNRSITPDEKRRIAYHEAGHAVIGVKLEYSDKVQRVTIIPRGRTGGHVLMTPENDRFLLTKQELIARITGFLGGRTSEELFVGDISTGASNDIEEATDIAREMVTEYGMSDLGPIQYEKNSGSVFLGRDYTSSKVNYSTQIAYEIDKSVRQIIDQCHEKAIEILTKYKDDVALIANTLVDKETITAEEISYLLEHRVLPPKGYKPDSPSSGTAAQAVSPHAESSDSVPAATSSSQAPLKTSEPISENKTISKAAQDLKINIDGLKLTTALFCLFVEDDEGKEITSRDAKKIIEDSTKAYVAKMVNIGEAPSIKLHTCSSMFIDKSLWKQFGETSADFGHYVEDESGVEVILVRTSSASLAKLKTEFTVSNANSGPLNKEAVSTADSLKDLVNHSDDDKK
jgi:cell division protease FtsH